MEALDAYIPQPSGTWTGRFDAVEDVFSISGRGGGDRADRAGKVKVGKEIEIVGMGHENQW
jgi:translation elongation factor EF-Tu-like GTPase